MTSTTLIKVLLFLVHPCLSTSQGTDLCPFELRLWYNGFGCAGDPNATTTIWADGVCELNNDPEGPGNYVATCDENNNIIFQLSGCKYSNCGDDPRLGTTGGSAATDNNAGSTTRTCPISDDPIASLYAELVPPENQVNSFDQTNYFCSSLRGQNVLTDTVSYAIFGDCSDYSCTRPSRSPTVSPSPTFSMPSTTVRAGRVDYVGPGKVSCTEVDSVCDWERNDCIASPEPGVTIWGSEGVVSFQIANICNFSCIDCTVSGGGMSSPTAAVYGLLGTTTLLIGIMFLANAII